MLIIPTDAAIEKITVTGKVPEHPDVHDFKPHNWSAKAIRPSKVKAVFQRTDGDEWTIADITVYGYDVLKSGNPSDNPNCWRDHSVSRDGATYPSMKDFAREQIELTAWAREWAQVHLARINDVTERADLGSDVHLGQPIDLDTLDQVCVDKDGEEWPEHAGDEIECRRCGADLSEWNEVPS